MFTSIELTQLRGVGLGQALQEVLHLSLGHLLQVDQGSEAVELLEPLLGPLRDLAGHLAFRVERENDSVEDVLLLHRVLWERVDRWKEKGPMKRF